MTAREYLGTLSDKDLIKVIQWHSLPYSEYQQRYGDHNELKKLLVTRIENMEDALDALSEMSNRLEARTLNEREKK